MLIFPRHCRIAMLLVAALAWICPARADCPHGSVHAVLSSPLSSRIDHRNDLVNAVLVDRVSQNGLSLPSGTHLEGRLLKVSPASTQQEGRLMVVFTRAILARGESQAITAMADTEDGWLDRADTGHAWEATPNHSTRLLNQKLMRRLGTDRAVWGQILGIRGNHIPDPTTDQFIVDYHARDVLLGAGDVLRLRLGCPGLFEIK